MKWTSAQRANEITALEKGAARQLEGAVDADQHAASATDDRIRQQNTAAGQMLRQQADDMRLLAQNLRDGYDPAELGYVDGPR